MRTVHKYALVEGRNNNLSMPRGAAPLTVQVQNSWPMLWAEVDTAQPLQHRGQAVKTKFSASELAALKK